MLSAMGVACPAAAKDVSMAGIAGHPRHAHRSQWLPGGARRGSGAQTSVGDWLTCFPGFGMLTAEAPGRPPLPAAPAVSGDCGELLLAAGWRCVGPMGN
jgi:hypothetical protein